MKTLKMRKFDTLFWRQVLFCLDKNSSNTKSMILFNLIDVLIYLLKPVGVIENIGLHYFEFN